MGRGGVSQRELVGGAAHTVTVKPSPTSPGTCTSGGDGLTLSTAGAVSSFTLVANDALGNRRPGKDSVDVLLYLPDHPAALPVAAQVLSQTDHSVPLSLSLSLCVCMLLYLPDRPPALPVAAQALSQTDQSECVRECMRGGCAGWRVHAGGS